MFKLLFVVLVVLAVATAQYVSTGYAASPYNYNGLYRSAAYTGYSAPYAYRSGYGGLGYYY
ncbi:hypothetical protein CBL_10785 [Carabus blaptoides fortunei]